MHKGRKLREHRGLRPTTCTTCGLRFNPTGFRIYIHTYLDGWFALATPIRAERYTDKYKVRNPAAVRRSVRYWHRTTACARTPARA